MVRSICNTPVTDPTDVRGASRRVIPVMCGRPDPGMPQRHDLGAIALLIPRLCGRASICRIPLMLGATALTAVQNPELIAIPADARPLGHLPNAGRSSGGSAAAVAAGVVLVADGKDGGDSSRDAGACGAVRRRARARRRGSLRPSPDDA